LKESNGVDFLEPSYIAHRQEVVLDALKKGDLEDLRVSQKWPVDKIVAFGLEQGFLQKGLKSFPDPRGNFEVPIDVILLCQILQRLNDEHSLLLAPYMLNSAELIGKLGYNANHIEAGFNDRAVHKRKASFHGETLKHILMSSRAPELLKWFNQDWRAIWESNAPGRTHQYIVDGTDIEIPQEHVKYYAGAGSRRNRDDSMSYGYKLVCLMEIIDKKGVIVALDIAPIQTHDIELARPLIEVFNFEPFSSIICDRGFIDGPWMSRMKREKEIDFFLPLRHNMQVTQDAISFADEKCLWKPHPTRKHQIIAEMPPPMLHWPDCPELTQGVLARWTKKDGTIDEVLFVTTKEKQTAGSILQTYDQRAEIEEMHREVKCFQSIQKLPSKKLTHVVFRILMGVIGYNLMTLFLNSEQCETFEQYTLKTLRQKRVEDRNPNVILYADESFAILRQFEFLPIVLELKRSVQKKLAQLFKNLNLSPSPI
jgi:Transposase DDE domain